MARTGNRFSRRFGFVLKACLSAVIALTGLLAVSASLQAVEPVRKPSAAAEPKKEESVHLPAPVVAIIDVQRILQESLAAKNVQQQLEAQRSKFQTEISGEETDLRRAEQELARLRENVKPDIFAEKEQQLRQRFLSVERHVQARRKVLDQAFTDSMNVVRRNLLEVVGAVAHERGANLVIVKQQALWSDKKMDITDEVLVRLNQSLPHVPVKVAPDEKRKPSSTFKGPGH